MQKPYSPKLIYHLSVAERQVQQWVKQQIPKDFPSKAQAGVLFVLHAEDGLLMGEITQHIQLAPSSLSGLIQRMEDADLIERKTCQNDARAIRIYLTARSRKIIPALIQSTQQLNQHLQQGFSADEIAIVERWLKHISTQLPPQN